MKSKNNIHNSSSRYFLKGFLIECGIIFIQLFFYFLAYGASWSENTKVQAQVFLVLFFLTPFIISLPILFFSFSSSKKEWKKLAINLLLFNLFLLALYV